MADQEAGRLERVNRVKGERGKGGIRKRRNRTKIVRFSVTLFPCSPFPLSLVLPPAESHENGSW